MKYPAIISDVGAWPVVLVNDSDMYGFMNAPREVVYPNHRADEFQAFLKETAYYLREFARDQFEYDLCSDVMKGTRLSPRGLHTLCELAARSDRPDMLSEGITRTVAQRRSRPSNPPTTTES